ncbi:MAG TPA: hypothetical protein VGM03_02775 [Phycisphaerae bacterium]
MNAATTTPIKDFDRVQLRALLRTYFRMSLRGRAARMMSRSRGGKPAALIFLLIMYTFIGLTTGPMALAHPDVFAYALIMHVLTFFTVGMSITSESGDVLFNVSENDVLGHRPIHPRTLLLAKSLNLLGYTFLLAFAINLFPMFFGLSAKGAQPWFPLVHLISVAGTGIFCAAAVVFVYGVIVRFVDREKFDNFATWSQVGMSVLFIGGYQLLPRLMERMKGFNLHTAAPYLLPLPPAWFAAADAVLAGPGPEPATLLLMVIGIAVTAALAYTALGRLAPSYGESLARLSEARARRRPPARRAAQPERALNPLLRAWLRDPLERSAFRLAAVYMWRDREMKMRLYPSLSMFIIFPLIGAFSRSSGFGRLAPLMTVWMLGMVPTTVLEALRMSSHHAAAELFLVAPLSGPAALFDGVRKAAIYYILIPCLLISGTLMVLLVPNAADWLPLTVPGLIPLPALSLMSGVMSEYLPLSRPPMRGEQAATNAGLMFGTMLTMAGLLGAAYLAQRSGWLWELVGVEAMVIGVVYWALRRVVKSRRMPRVA